jgi:hypothetical protein
MPGTSTGRRDASDQLAIEPNRTLVDALKAVDTAQQ